MMRLGPFGAGGQRALGVAIARQRIDHRPRHHHAAHARILRRRSGRQRDRRIARIVRPHGDQHGQMAAARLAGKADEVGPRLQLAGMRLGPAHRVIDVLHRGRIRVLVAGAEIERDRDDAVGRHVFVAQRFGQAVALAPGAAVALDQSRKRPLPRAAYTPAPTAACRRGEDIRRPRRRNRWFSLPGSRWSWAFPSLPFAA